MKLNKLIEKLAAFEPDGYPFISLYLDTQHNGEGREDFRIWIKSVERVLEDYAPGDDNSAEGELPTAGEKRQIADELIVRALNSGAKIIFIEDDSLLKEAGGVGAVLRYNMNATANA